MCAGLYDGDNFQHGLCAKSCLGWKMLQALSNDKDAEARTLALQAGLVLMILLNIKPATIVLLGGLMAGITISALRDPQIRMIKYLKLTPFMLVPGIVIIQIWNWYSSVHFPSGSHQIMPFENWQWHHMGQTLSTITVIMLKKGAYFSMMLILSAMSFIALFRYSSRFDSFALIAGSTFVGYNMFLLFVYLAIFSGYSGANALSYWRYNMHLAHLGTFCAAYGLSILWQTHLAERSKYVMKHLAKMAVVVLILLPIAFAPKLRFDIHSPKQFAKQVGIEIATILPKGARVIVIDPLSSGFYSRLMKYQLYRAATVTQEISAFSEKTVEGIRKIIDSSNNTHAWVHTQSKEVLEVLELDLPEHSAHLLEKKRAGWRLIKTWPYPGYDNPNDIKD